MSTQQQVSELLANVNGRSPESPDMSNFMKQPATSGQPQGGDQQSGTDIPGTLDLLQKKMKQVDDAQKKLFSKDLELRIKQTLMSSPQMKNLMDLQGQLGKQAVSGDFSVGGQKAGITNPVQSSNISSGLRGDAVQAMITAGNDIQTRNAGIGTILDAIGTNQKDAYTNAKDSFTTTQGLLNSNIAAQGAMQDAQKFPLELEQLRANIAKTRADAAKAAAGTTAGAASMTPSELLSYAKAFGVAPTVAAVNKALKDGAVPQSTAELDKNASLSQAKGFVDQLEAASNNVNTGKSTWEQLQHKAGKVAQGTDPDIATLNGLQATASIIVRSLGEKGTLSDGDINRIKGSLPQWSDTATVAKAKIAAIRSILEVASKNAVGTYQNQYTKDLPATDPNTITPDEAAGAITP